MLTDASNTGIGAALLQQHPTENEMNLILANSRLFTPIERRLSTLIRECTAMIFALTEYEFLLTGSNHPIILFSDHKPIIYLFIQKNKSNQRVYRSQLILMKFPNLHIIWAEEKNLALPDLLSRTINEEQFTRTRVSTVEIPENIKIFFAKTPLVIILNANIVYATIMTLRKQIKHIIPYLLTFIITSLKSISVKTITTHIIWKIQK